jgi:ABC-2 type transport system permease protein
VVFLFPVLRDAFADSLKNVPESFQKLIGNADDYKTLTGYVDIQVIGQMIFLTVIQGVLVGTSLLAGDESSGTLQTLLAYPVSRTKVYLQKFGAMLVLLALAVIVGIFFGVLIGEPFVNDTVPVGNLLAAAFMTWLLTAFFGSLAYALGAITGKRSLAGGVAGVYAFAGYMITSISASASSLKTLDYISPFHYFNSPSVMRHGLDGSNILVLVTVMTAFIVVGWFIFRRRDIYQR